MGIGHALSYGFRLQWDIIRLPADLFAGGEVMLKGHGFESGFGGNFGGGRGVGDGVLFGGAGGRIMMLILCPSSHGTVTAVFTVSIAEVDDCITR